MPAYAYDGEFVREIQARRQWPVFWGVGPFKAELEGRVCISYFGGSVITGQMMVPKPEYESLPEDIKAKLGEPVTALDDKRAT
jgi:hypothetical protein